VNYGEVTFVPSGLSIGLLKTPQAFQAWGNSCRSFGTPGAELITLSKGGMVERWNGRTDQRINGGKAEGQKGGKAEGKNSRMAE
jgi:hypothetical protein